MFRWIAQKRSRLAVVSLLLFAALLVPASPVATWIREDSASPTADMIILTVWLFLSLPASYLMAVLIGDLVFPDNWRERIILGKKDETPAPAPDDEFDLKALTRKTRSYKLPFYIIVVVLIGGSALLIQLITGSFLTEYQRMGYFRTLMRSDNHALKIELIDEMAKKHRQTYVETAVESVDLVWRDESQPKDVRLAALKTLGVLSKGLVTSVQSWEETDTAKGRWEWNLLEHVRAKIAPDLRPLAEKGPPELARAAALALGRMHDYPSLPLLERIIRDAEVGSPRWNGAVGALGVFPRFDGMPILLEAAKRARDHLEAFRLASWSIGEVSRNYRPPEDGEPPEIFGKIIDFYGEMLATAEPELRCVAPDPLMKTGDARITAVLMKGFDAPGSADIRCEPYELDIMAAVAEGVGEQEWLRRRILHAFKYVGKGNQELKTWAEARVNDTKYRESIRKNLQTLIGSI